MTRELVWRWFSALAICWSCTFSLLKPVGVWVVTDLLPLQHHALVGLAAALVTVWRTQSNPQVPPAKECERTQ